jgi:hypothetical protein
MHQQYTCQMLVRYVNLRHFEIPGCSSPARLFVMDRTSESSWSRTMKHSVYLFAAMILSACGLSPEPVSWSDTRLVPMVKAIEARTDRAALGFSPIDTRADVRLELASSRSYDAMLHICGRTNRTIAFRKTSHGYEWIGEQEIHRGPGKVETPDGEVEEAITLTFEIAPISGATPNQLTILYVGPKTELMAKPSLTYEDVAMYLASWSDGGLAMCKTQQIAARDAAKRARVSNGG